MKSKNLGYGDAERVADVMALIQVLALGKDTKRSENGLFESLQRQPQSAPNWSELARRHPEFFRVRAEDVGDPTAHRISLIARAAMPKEKDDKRDPLPSDLVGKLLDLAISLHDREIARSERWKAWLPVAVTIAAAIIAGGFTVAAAIIKSDSSTAGNTSPSPTPTQAVATP
jgi:hypothetical protein